MSVSYLLGKPVRWASWLCKRFDSSADWDPTGEKWQVTVNLLSSPTNMQRKETDLSWRSSLNSPHKHNELVSELLCLGIIEVQPVDSKILAYSQITASFPCFEKQVSSFWWHHYISTETLVRGEKGSKTDAIICKCRSNAQESVTKYPPWPQLTSSNLRWNNVTLCSD